jgi:hypothetical protein
MNCEIQLAYEEYCVDCLHEGKTPKSFWAWYHEGE